jgi:hypothetical protein
MLPTKEVLHQRYSAFSDQALLAAKAAGPKPYSPLAWEVIQALVKARGLSDRPSPNGSAPRTAPAAPTPKAFPAAKARPIATPEPREPAETAETAPSRAVSAYLLVSRLRRLRWPADDRLPLAARDVMAVAAVIYGAAALVLVVVAFVLRGQAAARAPGVMELLAASVLSLGFADSARRPPSPATWRLAILYCTVSPAFALSQIGTRTAPPWPQLALGAFVGLLWFLYFSRRRATYGLAPWYWAL